MLHPTLGLTRESTGPRRQSTLRPVGSNGPFTEHAAPSTDLSNDEVNGRPKRPRAKPKKQPPRKIDDKAARQAALEYERAERQRESERRKEEAATAKEQRRRGKALASRGRPLGEAETEAGPRSAPGAGPRLPGKIAASRRRAKPARPRHPVAPGRIAARECHGRPDRSETDLRDHQHRRDGDVVLATASAGTVCGSADVATFASRREEHARCRRPRGASRNRTYAAVY